MDKLQLNERLIREMKEEMEKMKIEFHSTTKPQPSHSKQNGVDEAHISGQTLLKFVLTILYFICMAKTSLCGHC